MSAILERAGQMLRRHRSLSLLALAIAFGALAAMGVRGYVAGQLAEEKARLVPKQEMVEVVVAKRDLERGELVGPDTMAAREVPREFLPGSAVLPAQFDSYLGMRLAHPMRSGEPLLHDAVEGADVTTFSAKIRPGIRALTVAVDEVNSVSGMLQPGDRIDLLFTVRPPSEQGAPPPSELTAPLMSDLLVLATGRQVRPGADPGPGARNFTSITVEVTPEQAQRLIVAQRSGRLTAMLRNPGDRNPVSQRPLDVYGLLGVRPAPPPVAPPPPPVQGPELIVGGRGGALRGEGQGAVAGAAAHPAQPLGAGVGAGVVAPSPVAPGSAAAPVPQPATMTPAAQPGIPPQPAPPSGAANALESLLRFGGASPPPKDPTAWPPAQYPAPLPPSSIDIR